MRFGIFAKTFPGTDPAEVLAAVRNAGYGAAQFNMACCGLAAMPETIGPATVAAVRAAAEGSGVRLEALSATYNMIHPDPAVRADGIRRLGVMLEAARALHIPLVTLCTGTRDPEDQWRHHPDNAAPQAWSDLAREMETALTLAEAAEVDLGIEPEQANVVTSATDARRLIRELGSRRLRIVLDPANLFERASREEARTIAARAVEVSGDATAMAHAKDRDELGAFVSAGRGVVDFPAFFDRLAATGFEGPVVTHGLSPDEAPAVAAMLRDLGLR